MKNLIVISGSDGAGKSTLIAGLKKKFELEGRQVAIASIWDVQEGIEPKRAVDYLPKIAASSRALLLSHFLFEALHRVSHKGVDLILFDAYWYKYLAAEVAYGLPVSAASTLSSLFPTPDRVIHLELPSNVVAARKQKLSRYECGFAEAPNMADFLQFQDITRPHLEGFLEKFAVQHPGKLMRIDAQLSAQEVLDQVFQIVVRSAL